LTEGLGGAQQLAKHALSGDIVAIGNIALLGLEKCKLTGKEWLVGLEPLLGDCPLALAFL
jgi:hypothetical protein